MIADIMAKWAMMPFDMTAWTMAVMNRKPPQWSSPNRLVIESPFAKLLDFSVGNDHVIPTLIFPPMAGHSSHVVDFKGQSQIQTVINSGLTQVFAFEWLSATQATKNVTIEDRLAFVTRAADAIAGKGGKLNIIGNCQGGWESSIWAALNPERVNSLIVAGSPIDTSVDINPDLLPMIRSFKAIGSTASAATIKAMLAFEGGVHRGLSQISMFVMMHPLSHPAEHVRLYNHIREPGAVERFTQFYDWYFNPVDMSGALFEWVLPHLFLNNELYKGTLVIGGKRVDLHNITAPVFLLAGEGDDITPKAQQLNMAKVIGSKHIYQAVAPGGHIGLFIGHRSQAEYWPPMLAAVRELS